MNAKAAPGGRRATGGGVDRRRPSSVPSAGRYELAPPSPDPGALPAPVSLGRASIHPVTRRRACDAIIAWADRGEPALVVTPNVDHLSMLQEDPSLQRAYDDARLQLCDGMAVLALARLAGTTLPERVTGADLFFDVCESAARHGLRVFVAGGRPDVLERGLKVLRSKYDGLDIDGHSPPVGFEGTPAEDELRRRLDAAEPAVVMVCFGAPRSEVWAADEMRRRPSVFMCVGAAIDFAAGSKQRAPLLMQRIGMEWLFRLLQEPGRLWRRYLVRDLLFLPVAVRLVVRARLGLER